MCMICVTEEIIEAENLGKHADYEGIKVIEDVVWIIRSDGILYEVIFFNIPKQETDHLKCQALF